jgi:hypothetical protein
LQLRKSSHSGRPSIGAALRGIVRKELAMPRHGKRADGAVRTSCHSDARGISS